MANDLELDSDVVAALRQNRKVQAIKLLRERENIGLKEAKHAVDHYLSTHPDIVLKQSSTGSYDGLLLFVFIAGLVYLGYIFLADA